MDTNDEFSKDGGRLLRGGNCKPINIEYFRDRLEQLYNHWRTYGLKFWQNAEVFIIQTPEASNNLRSFKSSVLNVWLFGVEFPSTTIIFTHNKIHFLCKNTFDLYLFDVLRDPVSRVAGLVFGSDLKSEDSGYAQLDKILHDAFQQRNNSDKSMRVGYLRQDDDVKIFLNQLTQAREYVEPFDITEGLSELFIIKNQSELEAIAKSALLNSRVMDPFFKRALKYNLDKDQNFTHSKLTWKLTQVILYPELITKLLSNERVNICYPPCVQSGEEFNFNPWAISNDNNLKTDPGSVIICSIGSSYDDYCSYVVRTYLIEPTERQKTVYKVLLMAHEAIINSLRVGVSLDMVYNSAEQVIRNSDINLLQYFTKSAGSGIGLEFSESILDINHTNNMAVNHGMVFNVSIGFQNLTDEDGKRFSLLLGDTVAVDDDGNSRVLTTCRKTLEDVIHPFKWEESKEYKKKLRLWIRRP
ncbi:hypothetical protein MKW92_002931 [Papaver armeniacum]|nr:hypothetical protein MKW92_002931 [Papaver armeniacum]